VKWVEGVCGECGRIIRRRSPAPVVVTCDCHRYCPLCGAEMTPYTPDLNPHTYRREDDPGWDPLSLASKGEASVETLYVCGNHAPPHYSDQGPVEVLLR